MRSRWSWSVGDPPLCHEEGSSTKASRVIVDQTTRHQQTTYNNHRYVVTRRDGIHDIYPSTNYSYCYLLLLFLTCCWRATAPQQDAPPLPAQQPFFLKTENLKNAAPPPESKSHLLRPT